MTDIKQKTHWIFWAIVFVGLLWNIMGVINYIMQMKPDFVASLPDTQRAIIEARPTWATVGFAVGVFGGTSGCLLLLLKKMSAGFVLMISLMGIFVTMIHNLNVIMSKSVFAVSEIFLMIVLPIVVSNFLIGFTFYAMRKNWIVSNKVAP